MRIETEQRSMTPDERAFFDARGDTSLQVGMRSMARLADGSDQTLVELKAVDVTRYPLYGDLVLGAAASPEPFARRGRHRSAPSRRRRLLDRLGDHAWASGC